jgi:kynurenine formamidase
LGRPSQEEVLAYFTRLSNKGRWGPDDALGTLNLITAEKRVAASRLVRSGRTVSCAWKFDTTHRGEPLGPPHRFMLRTGEGVAKRPGRQFHVSEYQGIVPHGARITHIDAPAHVTFDGELYNGYPADSITPEQGARLLDVVPAAQGIVTRGVFLDIPRHRGVDWIELGDLVDVAEVEDVLAKNSLELEAGDAVFLRTGNGRRMVEQGYQHLSSMPGPGGFDVSCMPLFHAKGVAILGADMPNDRNQSDYPEVSRPIHAIGVYVMGMWLIDNCNFEDLAVVSTEEGRADFQLFVSAIPFVGATGSPVSPIAIF